MSRKVCEMWPPARVLRKQGQGEHTHNHSATVIAKLGGFRSRGPGWTYPCPGKLRDL